MNILAIESSCDETAAAVVENGRRVLSSVVATQIPLHRPYSGVVPEIASRSHVRTINDVVSEALRKSKAGWNGAPHVSKTKIDAIAVTVGPGLVGSLLVGKMTAEALGWAHGVPVYGVNHIEGHLLSPLLEFPDFKPPFLGLIASGGHTELILAKQWGHYFLIGKTRDDAAGEAFDKVAKMLSLGYPGGPAIDQLAKRGRAERCPFPRAWIPGTWDFSFSGLKTAVLYTLRSPKGRRLKKADICAGFQEAVVDVLVQKTLALARKLNVKSIVVGGGVAANSRLRERLLSRENSGFRVYLSSPAMSTDNAAMIGAAAYFKLKAGRLKPGRLDVRSQIFLPKYPAVIQGFTPTTHAPPS